MDTAIEHLVPDLVKPSFVWYSDARGWAPECPDVKNCCWR